MPLQEIIAEYFGVGVNQKFKNIFELINRCGTEFEVLLDLDRAEFPAGIPIEILMALLRCAKKISLTPGYDGVYGKISVIAQIKDSQSALF